MRRYDEKERETERERGERDRREGRTREERERDYIFYPKFSNTNFCSRYIFLKFLFIRGF